MCKICDEYGVERPEFLEIGDMLRVNFYRPSYTQNGDKSGDKAQKTAINYKGKILEYLSKHSEARSQDIALFIGLKQSRTKAKKYNQFLCLTFFATHVRKI